MGSTADKFLGALVGAYLGHHLCSDLEVGLPTVDDSPICETWQAALQSSQSRLFSLQHGFSAMLPWLLTHHDHYSHRHHWIAQQLAVTSTVADPILVERLHALYPLGDCVEWLMQASNHTQQPEIALQAYFQTQGSAYPLPVHSRVLEWLPQLDHMRQGTGQNPPPTSPPRLAPMAEVLMAIQQCVHYRENLTLALAAGSGNASVSMLLGFLLGSWAGTTVIPMQWQATIPDDVMAVLSPMAEGLYRSWAGVADNASSFEVLPLDL